MGIEEKETSKEMWFHLLVGFLGLFAMFVFMYSLVYIIADYISPTHSMFEGRSINPPIVIKLEHFVFRILMLIGGLSLINSLRKINISKFNFLKKKKEQESS